MSTALGEVLRDKSRALPDEGQWINRFHVRSRSSDRLYVIAQHRIKRFWGCSCPGWRTHRKCTHLEEVGLPSFEKAFEPKEIAR